MRRNIYRFALYGRITGGWRGGQLVILAARPAMGKTAVALHFAQAAAGAGVPVCIFSLEMPATQLGGRMLVGSVDARAFRSGAVSTEDWQRIEPGAARLSELPVTIIDTPSISMPAIRHSAGHCNGRGGAVWSLSTICS